uniref:Retrovirus-related Pol polyprotein from transposon TNT 1-94 n=1 Tax=Tanacetum cinerariifolium TaxID=118510 RepID=A0A699GY60_TANCI|nr:retrovirus-related Pol polyprotein from transposon TNT 1-94 [Tanacetum cinerariifolium]
MAAVNDVPQLVGKKGGWSILAKTVNGDAKPESQWTLDEMKVVVQDQRLKSIIMLCLPDDIMKSVISRVSAKETWTDLVHSFEGPSDTKKNKIIDLKLDLPEKWLTFSQRLKNANHTQTHDLIDIYGMFVYEDNLIQRRYSNTKKALITTPSSTTISTAFFSNNVIQDFQENSNDEVDERSSEENLRDLDIEYNERALLANLKRFIKRRNNFSVNNYSLVYKGFQLKFTPKHIQSSPNLSIQTDLKFQKDYMAEYKKMKAKLALLEASPSSSLNSKTFPPKNKGLVPETFDWDEEEVSNDEEVTQVKVLMALADDELTIGKSHARNGCFTKLKGNAIDLSTLFSKRETRRHNRVIHIRGGTLTESSQSSESLIGVKCNTCGSTVHSTTDHNDFDHFKRAEKIQATKAKEPTKKPVSPMSINHKKYTLVIVDEYSRERIPDISYFYVFGCLVFIHNNKDHLGKFDAKADDGYFLGCSFVSKAFRVFNTRRQQIEKTYHVTFNESIEAIRQYQVYFDVSYYIIPYGRSLIKLTQENHVAEVIVPNESDIPHTEDTEGPPDLINTEGTHEQNDQNDQMIT